MTDFKCERCGISYSNPEDLELHELDVHDFEHLDVEKQIEVLSKIEHCCSECGKYFSSEYDLELHEFEHLDLDDQFCVLNGMSPETNNPPKKKRKMSIQQDFSPITGPSHVDSEVNQFGGAEKESLAYEIKKIGEKKFKNKAIDRHYRVQFNPEQALEGQKLSNLNIELENMFDDVLLEAKDHLQGNDLVRVIVHSDQLNNPIYVPIRPFDDMYGNDVMEYIKNVLSSHEELVMDEGFYVDVGTLELPKGGREQRINSLIGPNSSIVKKSSILEVTNKDNLCLAHAILLGFLQARRITTEEWKNLTKEDDLPIEDLILKYKTCPDWYFKMIRKPKNIKRQYDITVKLCHLPHVSSFRFLTVTSLTFLHLRTY